MRRKVCQQPEVVVGFPAWFHEIFLSLAKSTNQENEINNTEKRLQRKYLLQYNMTTIPQVFNIMENG